jgi:hypothetical protein
MGAETAWLLPEGTYVQALGACRYRFLAKRDDVSRKLTKVLVPNVDDHKSVDVLGVYHGHLELSPTPQKPPEYRLRTWFGPRFPLVGPVRVRDAGILEHHHRTGCGGLVAGAREGFVEVDACPTRVRLLLMTAPGKQCDRIL